MKAVVLHEYGGPDKLLYEEVPDPTPGPGEVLIRLAATSLNPIDWKVRSGAMQQVFPTEFPAILGRDVAGIIKALGPDVTGFAPGDRVFGIGSHSYAQLVLAKASEIAQLPPGLDLVESAALPVVTYTGQQLIDPAGIQPGQTVLVTGAVGAVGRSAVWVAKKAGATVLAGVRKKQLEEAHTLGADEVLALDDDAALNKLGFLDAVADTVNGTTAEKLIGKVKQGGIFATVVSPPANAKLHPTIRVQFVSSHPDTAVMLALAADVQAGHLKIPIDRMLPLEEAAEAHRAGEKGGVGKILLLG